MTIGSVATRREAVTASTASSASGIPAQYRQWLPMVEAAAKKYNLDPALIFAVMSRESGGRNIKGDGGHGRGLMQLDDRSWGSWLASHQGGMDPASNIMKGAEILRSNLDFFKGDIRKAVAAYNAGAGAVQKAVRNGRDPDSVTTGHNYSKDVLARMAQFKGVSHGGSGSPPAATPTPVPPGAAVLKEGSRGASVLSVQKELKAAGFDPGALDGIFGPKTEAAVKAFQRAHGLAADGVVGPKTMAALKSGHSAPVATPAPVSTGGALLKEGSRGASVLSVQKELKAAGFNPGALDGIFGPKTEAAVKAFQRAHGLAADGVVGPKTMAALRGDAFTPAAPSKPVSSSSAVLKEGSRGTNVLSVQRALKAAGFNPGALDGIFGPKTEAAVKAFQRAHGLAADGVVGPKTMAALRAHSSNPPASGVTPPPAGAPASAKVAKMLAEASSHVGFHEVGRDGNPFSTYFGRKAEFWCADFVSYCATKAGFHMNTPSAQGVQDTITARGNWKGRKNPQPGDVVTFDWAGKNGWADHVGLVEKTFVKNGKLWIQTIEGNSSDAVRRKQYPADSAVIKGYGTLS